MPGENEAQWTDPDVAAEPEHKPPQLPPLDLPPFDLSFFKIWPSNLSSFELSPKALSPRTSALDESVAAQPDEETATKSPSSDTIREEYSDDDLEQWSRYKLSKVEEHTKYKTLLSPEATAFIFSKTFHDTLWGKAHSCAVTYGVTSAEAFEEFRRLLAIKTWTKDLNGTEIHPTPISKSRCAWSFEDTTKITFGLCYAFPHVLSA